MEKIGTSAISGIKYEFYRFTTEEFLERLGISTPARPRRAIMDVDSRASLADRIGSEVVVTVLAN